MRRFFLYACSSIHGGGWPGLVHHPFVISPNPEFFLTMARRGWGGGEGGGGGGGRGVGIGRTKKQAPKTLLPTRGSGEQGKTFYSIGIGVIFRYSVPTLSKQLPEAQLPTPGKGYIKSRPAKNTSNPQIPQQSQLPPPTARKVWEDVAGGRIVAVGAAALVKTLHYSLL